MAESLSLLVPKGRERDGERPYRVQPSATHNPTLLQHQMSNDRGSRFRGDRSERGDRGQVRGSRDTNGRAHRSSGASRANGLMPSSQTADSRRPNRSKSRSGVTAGVDGPGEEVNGEEAITKDGEVEVCFICASPVEHISIAPCNHQTCHICSLRLRLLYKTRACAHCRVSKDCTTRIVRR